MKSRDFIIGFIVLVILVAGVLWFYKYRNVSTSNLPIETPNIVSKINTAFPNLTIPEGVERIELKDVTGGQNIGVATRSEIVANLPDLANGKFYQAWLENSEGKTLLLGNLKTSKSGWILSYTASKYPGYNKVIVKQGDMRILEGSF